jgi:hypothetical protein
MSSPYALTTTLAVLVALAFKASYGFAQTASSQSLPVLGTISLATGDITATTKLKSSTAINQPVPSKPVTAQQIKPVAKMASIIDAPAEAEKQSALSPTTSVRRVETEMPLVSEGLPLENPELKNKAINSSNELTYNSPQFTIRISTPFVNPQLIDKPSSNIEIIGQDIYLKPKTGQAIGIYITDAVSRQTVFLTLVPKNTSQ